jgi:hypothetical protein
MTISKEVREQVQQRANYACEFCGVREIDVGGTLSLVYCYPATNGRRRIRTRFGSTVTTTPCSKSSANSPITVRIRLVK